MAPAIASFISGAPRSIPVCAGNRMNENRLTRDGVEDRERKTFRKGAMILPIHDAMNAAVNPQRVYITR
jgi:hypothetical protein